MMIRKAKAGALLLAAAVLGGVGIAVAHVISAEAAAVDDQTIFCSQFVPQMESSSPYKKWANQNPSERGKWLTFRTALCAAESPASPVLATLFGKALVAVGEMALPETPPPTTTTTTTEPPPTTTEPPPTTTEPPPPVACADGLDNDADGKVDYPADPGCTSASDTDETDPAPPPPPTGASLYLSPSGSDAAACTQAAPCRTFERTYALAASGAVVSVGAGVYPAQNFAGGAQASQPAGTKAITFLGQPGNAVRQLHVGSPNMTFDGINVDAGGAKTSGAAFENGGGDNLVFKNGSIGNVTDEKGALVDGNNILFDNVLFHDAVLQTDGVHMECLYAIVVPGMTIRNSTFTNCAVMDLFFTYGDWWVPRPPAYGNVTLEGNTFGASRFDNGVCCHYYGLYIGNVAYPAPGQMNGWTIRNNFFENDVAVAPSLGSGNVFCGNTGQAPSGWTGAC